MMETEEQVEQVSAATDSPKPTETSEPVVEEQGNNQETKAASPRSTASSPEPNCPICLGKPENKSFTDSCFHQFCFTCLLEWSKIKAQCPLCKQPFNSIVHNVRSDMDYDQYHLRPASPFHSDRYLNLFSSDLRFRYRTTLTAERSRMFGRPAGYSSEHLARRRRREHRHYPFYPRHYRQPYPVMTSQFRSHVYSGHLWVRPSPAARLRDTSASFFRTNPACTHRLIPWVNRELCALLYNQESHVAFVLELIVSLLVRYDILSPEFREHVRPYLMMNTTHFIHEFYHFARSPFDMIAYDGRAEYGDESVSTAVQQSDSDSDVVILTPESRVEEVEVINVTPQHDLLETHNPEPPQSSSTAAENPTLLQVKRFLDQATLPICSSVSEINDWVFPNRTQPPATAGDSTPEAGPSGLSRYAQTPPLLARNRPLVYTTSDSDEDFRLRVTEATIVTSDSDSEDCMVVGYVKPIKERTPVIVNLTSDTDIEAQEQEEVKEQPDSEIEKKGRYSKRINNHRKRPNYCLGEGNDDDSDLERKGRFVKRISRKPPNRSLGEPDSELGKKGRFGKRINNLSKKFADFSSDDADDEKDPDFVYKGRYGKRLNNIARKLSSSEDETDEDLQDKRKLSSVVGMARLGAAPEVVESATSAPVESISDQQDDEIPAETSQKSTSSTHKHKKHKKHKRRHHSGNKESLRHKSSSKESLHHKSGHRSHKHKDKSHKSKKK